MLLDLESFDLSGIFQAVVENMVITDQLSRANQDKVLDILMSKHRHQYQQTKLKRNFSFSSLSSFAMDHSNVLREKSSGNDSAIEMEAREEVVDLGKEAANHGKEAVNHGKEAVNHGKEAESIEKTNNDASNMHSVMFEIGDIDVDNDAEGFRQPFIGGDSSDDEKVCYYSQSKRHFYCYHLKR